MGAELGAGPGTGTGADGGGGGTPSDGDGISPAAVFGMISLGVGFGEARPRSPMALTSGSIFASNVLSSMSWQFQNGYLHDLEVARQLDVFPNRTFVRD